MALLPKNQRDQVMVLLVIVAVALIGLYYTYVFSPKADVLAALQSHVDSLDVSNQRAKAELAGRKVKCPSCAQPVLLPTPGAIS